MSSKSLVHFKHPESDDVSEDSFVEKLSVENLSPNDTTDPSYTKLKDYPYYIICQKRIQTRIKNLRRHFREALYLDGVQKPIAALRIIRELSEPMCLVCPNTNRMVTPKESYHIGQIMEDTERYKFL